MYDVISKLGSFASSIIDEFAKLFRLLIIENKGIGEVIGTYLPDIPFLSDVLNFLLPFSAFEFLILSIGLWLSLVVVKFIIDVVT